MISFKRFVGSVALVFVVVSVFAQSEAPKIFEVIGKEVPISEIPAISGRWFDPMGNKSQTARVQNGTAYVWTGQRCGEDQLKIIKAYKEGNVLTVETDPSKDQIRCSFKYGAFISFNTDSKKGTYGIKDSQDTTAISIFGRFEMD